ncbi:hypothetical protein Hanom_Chr07g00586491 [Helianthus anomalus]
MIPNGPNPLLRVISSFPAFCLRSCSLNSDLRLGGSGPVWGVVAAPVSRCTTARKFDGSAWTKVVVGGELESEDMMDWRLVNEE